MRAAGRVRRTDPGGSWEARLFALLDEAPLVLAGEDFCNDYFVRGSEFPHGLTWRHWGHEIAEWLNARGGTHGAVLLPWTYMDFYMRSRVPIDEYAAWADTVLALLRASSARIATAVATLGSGAT